MAVQGFADEVAKSLKSVMPSGFTRKRREWTRVSDGLISGVRVVRNEPYEFGEELLIYARVQLESGRGVGYWFGQGTHPPSANWRLRDASNLGERQRISQEMLVYVEEVSLAWIEERATPAAYVDHLRDAYQPYQRIEAFLAFGPDQSLAAVLAEGPRMEVPTTLGLRQWGATSAEAALRAYEHLKTPPSAEWRDFAHAVLKSYRGRPPKSDRAGYLELKARVDALPPRAQSVAMQSSTSTNHEERGLTQTCSRCGIRIPRSDTIQGMCPPCYRSSR